MQASVKPDEEPAGQRILYAEDDPFVRSMTTRVLTRAGYSVTSVENGELAWEALQTQTFALLITDNDMPQLTGIQLVAKLRERSVLMPIILASGSAGYYGGEEFRWLKFNACLQKPFAPQALVSAVQAALA